MPINAVPKPPRREKRPRKPLRKQGRAIARKTAPKKKRRTASEFQRIYGSKERVAWVKQQPCVVCHAVPSENAHTENGGMGRKGDANTIVPLCRTHHREFHAEGSATWNPPGSRSVYHYGRSLLRNMASVYDLLWREQLGSEATPPPAGRWREYQEGTKGGRCSLCRYPIARGETVCGECACEDDSE